MNKNSILYINVYVYVDAYEVFSWILYSKIYYYFCDALSWSMLFGCVLSFTLVYTLVIWNLLIATNSLNCDYIYLFGEQE